MHAADIEGGEAVLVLMELSRIPSGQVLDGEDGLYEGDALFPRRQDMDGIYVKLRTAALIYAQE